VILSKKTLLKENCFFCPATYVFRMISGHEPMENGKNCIAIVEGLD